jgi:hypothetical protein
MKRIISMLWVLAVVGYNGKKLEKCIKRSHPSHPCTHGEVNREKLNCMQTAYVAEYSDTYADQLLIRSVMIDTEGQQGISFLSGPKVIQTMNEQHEWNW